MSVLSLDRRLKALYDEIPAGSFILDVGTDHGKLPVFAVKSGRAVRAIITDISAPSLSKAVRLSDQEGVTDKIDARVCDGLTGIKEGEADTLIISGMGGHEIIRILSAGVSFARYILAPNSDATLVREFLIRAKISIVKDRMVKESGHFYNIITGRPEKSAIALTPAELKYGKDNYGNPDFELYRAAELHKLAKFISLAGEDAKAELKMRAKELEEVFR